MAQRTSRKIVLVSRPNGSPTPANFRLEEGELPGLKDGQVLLETLWLSLDPYMRGQMNAGPSYTAGVDIGTPMKGDAISRVVESRAPNIEAGAIVEGYTGWQSFAVANGKHLRKINPIPAPLAAALGVLGMPGMTAYVGLLNIGQPKAGETLVVAAATGPVGSLVGQIAKMRGLKVVGIAGSLEKCQYVREELRFDAALDHRDPDLAAELKKACPDGIDIYFENVGGHVWQAVFPLLNNFARVPVCGLIAHYSDTELPIGVDHSSELMMAILRKRLMLRGFIVSDFDAQADDFRRDVSTWLQLGLIKHREHIVVGLENAPAAFIGMLKGKNFGKVVVKVAD